MAFLHKDMDHGSLPLWNPRSPLPYASMLQRILLSLLAVLVIIEEWLWDILTLAGKGLSHLLHLERFDEHLARASPNQALFALLIPLLIVTPINLLALFLLTHGAVMQGIALEIVAKLLGTLLVARVFRLVRASLLTFAWFAWIYHTITAILRWAHQMIRSTALYRMSIAVKNAIKRQMARLGEFWRGFSARS